MDNPVGSLKQSAAIRLMPESKSGSERRIISKWP